MSSVIDFQQAVQRLGLRAPHPPRPTLESLKAAWLADRRADGRRPRGVQNYAEVFQRFIAFAGNIPTSEITVDLVKDYKRDLANRVAPATARHALTVVRAFCAWCVTEGHLADNPALRVPHPKVEAPDPDPLTRAQIDELLRALDMPQQSHKYTRARNRRAVCLMLYAGLRLSEAAGLEKRDIDLERREIRLRREIAKGGKPRMVPICDELHAELAPVRAYQPGWAVVDQGDTPRKRGTPLTFKSLAHLFERWLPKRIDFPVHAHQLRKTFATELYVRGEDLVTIQRLLGHTDPKTTLRYIGASARKERAAVARLSFRAELDQEQTE